VHLGKNLSELEFLLQSSEVSINLS
jgi:hypothetical protein